MTTFGPRSFTPKKDSLIHLAAEGGRCVFNCPACAAHRFALRGFEAEARRAKRACQILLEENAQLRRELDESQANEAELRDAAENSNGWRLQCGTNETTIARLTRERNELRRSLEAFQSGSGVPPRSLDDLRDPK